MVKLLCLEWSRMDEGGLHNTCYKDSANGTFRMPWDIRQDEGWTGNGSHRSNGMELALLLVQPKLHRELEKCLCTLFSQPPQVHLIALGFWGFFEVDFLRKGVRKKPMTE